jgi:hypothetical protein
MMEVPLISFEINLCELSNEWQEEQQNVPAPVPWQTVKSKMNCGCTAHTNWRKAGRRHLTFIPENIFLLGNWAD